jgi:hypothetical protein
MRQRNAQPLPLQEQYPRITIDDVRFWGVSGHETKALECLLLTQSVHGISYTVVSSAMPRSAARRIDGCKLWL